MNNHSTAVLRRASVAGLCLLAVSACNTIRPDTSPRAAIYSLDSTSAAASATAPNIVRPVVGADALTLIVNPPHAAAGFDSPHIIYVREPGRIQYFAQSEWVDTPARMIAPLLVAAMSASGAFRAVTLTPSAAAGDLRLDTEIVRLQHEFLGQPSRVRFTLRAYLVDDRTRRVVAWREFESDMPATSEDPQAGIVAAGKAIQSVLDSLAVFCAEAARSLPIERQTTASP